MTIATRLGCGVVLAHTVVAARPVCAQSVLAVRPSISATQVHETNLFSTASDPVQDFITRVTPSIDSEYRSALMRLVGRYSLDAEAFAAHSDLNTPAARQQGTLTVRYTFTPRLIVDVGGEFVTTRTPGELNTDTSLTFTRARASRFTAHSLLTRKLAPLYSGSVGYTFTQDHLAGLVDARTHTGRFGLERRLSPRAAITGSYRFSDFSFSSSSPGSSATVVDSHTLAVGWNRSLARNVTFVVEAGPRLTDGIIRPEWTTSIDAHFSSTDLSLVYGRTQNTVIGVVGTAEVQHVTAAAGWDLGRSLRVRVAPSFFRNTLDRRQADVYALRLDVIRPIARRVAIDLAVDASTQRGQLLPGTGGQAIDRRSVAVRLVTGQAAARPE